MDCAYLRDGCQGGLDPDAWNYVKSKGGIATQTNSALLKIQLDKINENCTFIYY